LNYNPVAQFARRCIADPDRIALVADGVALTYAEAAGYARAIACALRSAGRPGARVGILGSRSIAACLAVLGTCWSGATYVPLGLKLPEERLVAVLRSSRFDALIADGAGEALLTAPVLAAAPEIVLLADNLGDHGGRDHPHWRLRDGVDDGSEPAAMKSGDVAYIEFTSGTTGTPKGVVINAGALHHFISLMQDLYALTPDDRVAETTDLSFDISAANMFMTWNAGASLYIVSRAAAWTPAKFIRENDLTMWHSVPSVIAFLQRTKMLRPGSLPSLRHSAFAGEPLPAAAAAAWMEAAPNSTLDNLYGPTEATVECLRQAVTETPRLTLERGTMAIGRPLPGMDAAILDEELRFVPFGVRGQIALSGPQLAVGYLDQPELTAARFPTIDGRRWYLTSDFGYQDEDGIFHHLGRIDNQVKVLGNRVELEDIDVHLRRAGGTMSVAAVAWPIAHGSASGIVAFVAGAGLSGAHIREALRGSLPAYMIPQTVVELESLPLNANGKVDRLALVALLDDGKA
jgi:amino acid adenylation domain-containing protein